MRAMRWLAMSGSLRGTSTNTRLLRAAMDLAPSGVGIELYDGLGDLPHFNPDLDTGTPPEPVQRLRALVGASDGLVICTPEYAHGLAGSFKNALDWLVSSLEFPDKPVAILNAAARAHHADGQLREVLTTMSASICEAASVTLTFPRPGMDSDAMISDPEVAGALGMALAAFATEVGKRSSQS